MWVMAVIVYRSCHWICRIDEKYLPVSLLYTVFVPIQSCHNIYIRSWLGMGVLFVLKYKVAIFFSSSSTSLFFGFLFYVTYKFYGFYITFECNICFTWILYIYDGQPSSRSIQSCFEQINILLKFKRWDTDTLYSVFIRHLPIFLSRKILEILVFQTHVKLVNGISNEKLIETLI